VAARAHAAAQQAAGFFAADSVPAVSGHVAVAGVDLGGLPTGADPEGGDPLGWRGPPLTAPFLLGLPLSDYGDLVVDALQPHRVPHP
jgi:hypothetical protein